jgi:hypothetical protein
VLVYLLAHDPTPDDETALERARRARVPVVAVAPAATRVEWRGRCRTTLFGAASAIEAALNATSRATRRCLTRRIMRLKILQARRLYGFLSTHVHAVAPYNKYASANPICATNIMRYMCAHDT